MNGVGEPLVGTCSTWVVSYKNVLLLDFETTMREQYLERSISLTLPEQVPPRHSALPLPSILAEVQQDFAEAWFLPRSNVALNDIEFEWALVEQERVPLDGDVHEHIEGVLEGGVVVAERHERGAAMRWGE